MAEIKPVEYSLKFPHNPVAENLYCLFKDLKNDNNMADSMAKFHRIWNNLLYDHNGNCVGWPVNSHAAQTFKTFWEFSLSDTQDKILLIDTDNLYIVAVVKHNEAIMDPFKAHIYTGVQYQDEFEWYITFSSVLTAINKIGSKLSGETNIKCLQKIAFFICEATRFQAVRGAIKRMAGYQDIDTEILKPKDSNELQRYINYQSPLFRNYGKIGKFIHNGQKNPYILVPDIQKYACKNKVYLDLYRVKLTALGIIDKKFPPKKET